VQKVWESLNTLDWDQIFSDDVSYAWADLEHKFMTVVQEAFPESR